MMRCYRFAHSGFPGSFTVWDNIKDLVEEVKTNINEGQIGDEMYISIVEMSEEEFNSLKEFEGY